MILTGPEIRRAWEKGEIEIDPFDPDQINPNTYNYRLSNVLIEVFALASGLPDAQIQLGEQGFQLLPGRLYLSSTHERIGSSVYVTTLLGRSSVGRLGLFLNVSADLGHCGAISHWTLELKVVQPLRVYPRMQIGQVAFWSQKGSSVPYNGRYQSDRRPERNKDLSLLPAGLHP